MADIEEIVFPAFTLDTDLKIVSKNFVSARSFSALRVGKSASLITDEDGMNKLRALKPGESASFTCFCPAPVGALAFRMEESILVRINPATAALVEHARDMQRLNKELFTGFHELCAGETVDPRSMPRLRRLVFMQERINEYIARALLPQSERFCRTDFVQTASGAAAAASGVLSETGRGVVCTGDLSSADVFVSLKDISYMILALVSVSVELSCGRLTEIRISRTKASVSAEFMFSVSPRKAAVFLQAFSFELPERSDTRRAEERELSFLASYSRLLCELNGGSLTAAVSDGVACVRTEFPICRDDTVTLSVPPLLVRELEESARAFLGMLQP